MAGLALSNNDAHNTFIERTIGPEVFRINFELSQRFSSYFSLRESRESTRDEFPRFKFSKIPADILELLGEDQDPTQSPKEAPVILIEGLRQLMAKLKLTGSDSILEDKIYFKELLNKTFQASNNWNLFKSGVGDQTIQMSNQELLGLIFLGLKSLTMEESALSTSAMDTDDDTPPLAGAGGPGGGSGSSGASSGGSSKDGDGASSGSSESKIISPEASRMMEILIEKLLDYLRNEEDLTLNCGTRYRNSLMMFLQSAGYPEMKIVLSAKDFISMMIKNFVNQEMAECFEKDKTKYSKSILQTENTIEALSLVLNPSYDIQGADGQLAFVKNAFKLFLEKISKEKRFNFSSREWKEIHDLIDSGEAYFDPLLEACPLVEKGSPLFNVQILLAGDFIKPGSVAHRGLLSKINELVAEPAKTKTLSYVQEPIDKMKELNDTAQELRDIIDRRRSLVSRKLEKESPGSLYMRETDILFSEGSEAVSMKKLKIELSNIKRKVEAFIAPLEDAIHQRSSGMYAEIENIFVFFFSKLTPEERALKTPPSYRRWDVEKISKFIASCFNQPILTDGDCDCILKRSIDGGHLEITVYDLNRVLIHALKEPPEKWSPDFYVVFNKVIDLIRRNFEGSVIAVSQGLKEGSYPDFLIESLGQSQRKYEALHPSALVASASSSLKMEGEESAEGAGMDEGGESAAPPSSASTDKSPTPFLDHLLKSIKFDHWVLILNSPDLDKSIKLALIKANSDFIIKNSGNLARLIKLLSELDSKEEAIAIIKTKKARGTLKQSKDFSYLLDTLHSKGFPDEEIEKFWKSFSEIRKFKTDQSSDAEALIESLQKLKYEADIKKYLDYLLLNHEETILPKILIFLSEVGLTEDFKKFWENPKIRKSIISIYYPLAKIATALHSADLDEEIIKIFKHPESVINSHTYYNSHYYKCSYICLILVDFHARGFGNHIPLILKEPVVKERINEIDIALIMAFLLDKNLREEAKEFWFDYKHKIQKESKVLPLALADIAVFLSKMGLCTEAIEIINSQEKFILNYKFSDFLNFSNFIENQEYLQKKLHSILIEYIKKMTGPDDYQISILKDIKNTYLKENVELLLKKEPKYIQFFLIQSVNSSVHPILNDLAKAKFLSVIEFFIADKRFSEETIKRQCDLIFLINNLRIEPIKILLKNPEILRKRIVSSSGLIQVIDALNSLGLKEQIRDLLKEDEVVLKIIRFRDNTENFTLFIEKLKGIGLSDQAELITENDRYKKAARRIVTPEKTGLGKKPDKKRALTKGEGEEEASTAEGDTSSIKRVKSEGIEMVEETDNSDFLIDPFVNPFNPFTHPVFQTFPQDSDGGGSSTMGMGAGGSSAMGMGGGGSSAMGMGAGGSSAMGMGAGGSSTMESFAFYSAGDPRLSGLEVLNEDEEIVLDDFDFYAFPPPPPGKG
jgi:hypothetical protein